MLLPDGSAKAATGQASMATANRRNPEKARARIRKELNDILYPGALTSRLKRYAAEPAPDNANLTTMCERTANLSIKLRCIPPIAGTDRPVVRQSRQESPVRPC